MQLEASVRKLLRRARAASRRAHAPYSGFTVGVALETESGEVFEGANMENAAFPSGLCAERVALLLWRSRSTERILRVAVSTPSDPPGFPCGPCREALAACAADAEVWLVGPRKFLGPMRVMDLIPRPPISSRKPSGTTS